MQHITEHLRSRRLLILHVYASTCKINSLLDLQCSIMCCAFSTLRFKAYMCFEPVPYRLQYFLDTNILGAFDRLIHLTRFSVGMFEFCIRPRA